MAGQEHHVNIGDDDLLPPWTTLFEIADATATSDWVLVGGLMVQLHAHRAQIPPPRATQDVDIVVNVAAKSVSLSRIAGALRSIRFEPIVPQGKRAPIYRFQRDKEQVDVMVADHLPSRINPRLMMRPAFSVTAGEQAIRRRDTFVVTSTTRTAQINAPDILGALVAKGAASVVDQRDTERHLDDAAVLLACIDSVGDLDLSVLSKNDRKRLNAIASVLRDDVERAWTAVEGPHRLRGQQNLARLIVAAGLEVSSRT